MASGRHRPVLGKNFAHHYQPRAAQFILVKAGVTRYRQNIASAIIRAAAKVPGAMS
jgi:hypothetical protein